MEKDRQIEIMKSALERIANVYGNPHNPQEAVIIARDSVSTAKAALSKVSK